jgi:hypothetical protein
VKRPWWVGVDLRTGLCLSKRPRMEIGAQMGKLGAPWLAVKSRKRLAVYYAVSSDYFDPEQLDSHVFIFSVIRSLDVSHNSQAHCGTKTVPTHRTPRILMSIHQTASFESRLLKFE